MMLFSIVTCLPAQEQAAREDLRGWKYAHSLSWSPDQAGQWLQLPLPPSVFEAAQSSLADLRLADEQGRAVPYALRTLDGSVERQDIDARRFDRVTLSDGSERLTLDLGERPPEHNALRLEVTQKSYGREFLLEASEDGTTFHKLFQGELVYLAIGNQSIDQRSFIYPASRARYVRVTLKPDRVRATEGTILRDVFLSYRDERPARRVERQLYSVSPREAIRHGGDAASAWRITLQAREPISALQLRTNQRMINRSYILQRLPDEEQTELAWEGSRDIIARGRILREADAPNEPIVLRFGEVQAKRLRLIVVDSRNAPLDLNFLGYEATARVLLFRAPAQDTDLNLFVGSTTAPAPNYEITLPEGWEDLPTASLSPQHKNPAFVPPPPPVEAWTERNRWLLDGSLIASLLVLGSLLTRMALTGLKQAAREDQEVHLPEQSD
jgi:hypothetical protein